MMRRTGYLFALLPMLALSQTTLAQVSRPGQTFPGLGNYSIGSHEYDNAAVIAHAALDDVYIIATTNGWQSSHSMTVPTVEAEIASQSVRGTKIISYFDPLYMQYASPAFLAQMNRTNFWLRQGWPNGSISIYNSAQAANVYPGGPAGVGGRTFVQYVADYNVDWMYNGNAAGLSTDGKDVVNSALAGVYMDDVAPQQPATGDWARTGAAVSGTAVQVRTAYLQIAQRFRQDKPGLLMFANLSGGQDPRNVITEYVGQFDGGVMEHMTGLTWSIENIGGDASLGVTAYKKQMSMLNSNQLGIFAAEMYQNGTDDMDRAVPYRAFRHAFAMCLVVGNALCAPTTANRYSATGDAALWFDEESVNLATRQPYTKPDASAAPGLGYLGTAVDPPQTAPYQNGYWRRRFQNGEVWWSPRQASAGTINFGRTVYFIKGTEAPGFNNGGSGTTHSIDKRDGIIVLYQDSGTATANKKPSPPSGLTVH
jgi:hypothetical protein